MLHITGTVVRAIASNIFDFVVVVLVAVYPRSMFSAVLKKGPLHVARRVGGQFECNFGSIQLMTASLVQQSPLDIFKQQIRLRSNRSRRGLYDGKDIGTGNSRSFSMRATKRKFKPNVIIKRVYSEILDDMIRFHMTTSALRSIDKAGGLDNYLFKIQPTEGEGYKILKKIKKRLKNQAQRERKAARESAAADAQLSPPIAPAVE